MKVTKSVDKEINIINIIDELEKKHGTIYWEIIENIIYVYKPCGRRDFNEIISNDELDSESKEDEFIKKTLLYPVPDEVFFGKIKAGIFKRLLAEIMKSSHLREEDMILRVQITNSFRSEMFDMQQQVTCIIHEAFPEYDIEDVENWGIEKTAKFLTRSEWILQNLRSLPIDAEMAEAAMAGNPEKYKELLKNIQDKQEAEDKEREADIKPVTTKKTMTPENLEELKIKFPEIDWENDSVNKMGEAALNDSFKQSPATETMGFK